jgi:hypothetical protein
MTLDDILELVKSELAGAGIGSLSDTELNGIINDGYTDIASRAFCIEETFHLYTAAGEKLVKLPKLLYNSYMLLPTLPFSGIRLNRVAIGTGSDPADRDDIRPVEIPAPPMPDIAMLSWLELVGRQDVDNPAYVIDDLHISIQDPTATTSLVGRENDSEADDVDDLFPAIAYAAAKV